ncbi:hypothetical protein SNE40_019245 [Patella caerulea]|uniref:EGF-like domain-containing protein n=1 Tax=Patella caerulea TaxID=87958 RepID=A0AAN8JA86_PATCE
MLHLTLTPHISEGCGRTPSKPPLDFPTHRHPCSDEEAQRSKCLNGGECYTLDLYSTGRSAHCQCREIYQGQRCEEISPDIFREGKVDTANAVSGVVVVITLVIVIIVFCFLRLYYRS